MSTYWGFLQRYISVELSSWMFVFTKKYYTGQVVIMESVRVRRDNGQFGCCRPPFRFAFGPGRAGQRRAEPGRAGPGRGAEHHPDDAGAPARRQRRLQVQGDSQAPPSGACRRLRRVRHLLPSRGRPPNCAPPRPAHSARQRTCPGNSSFCALC